MKTLKKHSNLQNTYFNYYLFIYSFIYHKSDSMAHKNNKKKT